MMCATIHLLTARDYLALRSVVQPVLEWDVLPNTNYDLVGSLGALGVLEEITGRRRNRVYAAREIIEVLQELRPLPYGLTRTRGIIAGSW